jgi:hypothetical protein
MEEGTAPVFKLTDLADIYGSRIKQLGGVINTKVHTTRLKLRLLAQFPDLQAHLKGTDILLAFQDDIGPALAKACEKDMDNDAVHQTAGVQKAYAKDVTSLVAVLEELGNPFEEESKDDLIVLDTKEMAAPAVVETVRNDLKIGKDQFELFTKDRLIDRSKSLHDVISRNKLPLFNTPTIKPVPKSKQALTTMKGDMELFSRMYIGCQTRDGNLDDVFQHENRAYPPSLSEGGNLCLGSKSDLLNCMEELSKAKS